MYIRPRSRTLSVNIRRLRNVVVIGVHDPQWSEAIKAVCLLRTSKKVTADEIINFVGEKIAR